MVNITYIPVPESSVSYKKSGYWMNPTRIVIHNTANKATARNEVAYMHRSDSYTSYHYAVDDQEIIQALRLDQNGWHASDGEWGVGNREGIGFEICYSYDATDPNDQYYNSRYRSKFEKAQKNAADLTAYLLHELGWGLDLSRVTKHADYCDKWCPHRTLNDYGWDYFLNLVKESYNTMYPPQKPTITPDDDYIVIPEEEEENMTQADFNKFMDAYLAELAKKDGSSWSKTARNYCIQKGYFKGDENGNYKWKSHLTREEMAQLLYNLDH